MIDVDAGGRRQPAGASVFALERPPVPRGGHRGVAMAEQETGLSINDVLFVALVRDFESMAMVGFGKLLDPVSQKAERDLDRAKIAIDMLGMLEQKTKGNLDGTQEALLQQVLTNLRLNYVDEVQRQEAEKKADKGEGAKEPEAGAQAERQAPGQKEPDAAREGAGAQGQRGAEKSPLEAEKADDGSPAGEGSTEKPSEPEAKEAPEPKAKKASEPKTKRGPNAKGKTGGGEGGNRR